ncbi:methyl-accepting chemotaxis protein, partial [Campylobacter volucris]|nr:methyl-accepting chemotaxis protein [Campylobacter volucris]
MQSLANKLTLFVCLAILSILFVANVVNYMEVKNDTQKLINDLQIKTIQDVLKTFESYNNSRGDAVKAISTEMEKNPYASKDEIYKIVRAVRDASNFDVLYVGLAENGAMIRSNGRHQMPSDGYDPRTRGWYTNAASGQDKVYISKPYMAPSLKAPSLAFSYPIIVNGKFIGAAGGNYDLKTFSDNVLSMGKSASGFVTVIDNDGTILFHEITERLLKKTVLSENIVKTYLNTPEGRSGELSKNAFIVLDDKGVKKAVICQKNSLGYNVCAIADEKIYSDPVNEALVKQILIGIASLIVALIVIRLVIQYNLSPLQKIQSGLNSFFDFINHKTKDSNLIDVKTNDEFGAIAK